MTSQPEWGTNARFVSLFLDSVNRSTPARTNSTREHRSGVVRGDAQTQLPDRLGRDHPATRAHGPLGVDFLPDDDVVHATSALETELVLHDDLDLGADVGLLDLPSCARRNRPVRCPSNTSSRL